MHKEIHLTKIAALSLSLYWANVITNLKLRNFSKGKEESFINLILFTFSLSLHNFSPVYSTAAIQMLKNIGVMEI